MEKQISIETSWFEQLKDEFHKNYFDQLKTFLLEEKKKYTIYPKGSEIFMAFNLTPFSKVKVVIIGQDPYHGEGQAHGLSFSVPFGIKPPPSLVNMYKELKTDVNFIIPNHGNLTSWAKQGVLLLNATLTVRQSQPGSHQQKGWEQFTDAAIKAISERKQNVVFILWGKFAQNKELLVNTKQHLVLKAAHPSPFSAHNGFFGCKHFSKTNNYLTQKNIEAINWQL